MSVYFDHNASSPLHSEVLGAMMPHLREGAANVSSLHSAGAQEKYRRAGTENVSMIVGLGKAAQIAALEIEHKRYHLEQLRTVFETRLLAIPGAVIFGQAVDRLPNTTYFSIPYYHGETLLMELDKAGFALASGSACHSAVTQAVTYSKPWV